jgi:hypothetical protein
MATDMQCPDCGIALNGVKSRADEHVKCPACGNEFLFRPAQSDSPAAVPAASSICLPNAGFPSTSCAQSNVPEESLSKSSQPNCLSAPGRPADADQLQVAARPCLQHKHSRWPWYTYGVLAILLLGAIDIWIVKSGRLRRSDERLVPIITTNKRRPKLPVDTIPVATEATKVANGKSDEPVVGRRSARPTNWGTTPNKTRCMCAICTPRCCPC